jgi:hypothetical protein
MLVIRNAQLREFERAAARRFAERMTLQVEKVWPEECRRLGHAFTAARVQAAVERAMRHALATQYDIGRFVHLVFALDDLQFDRQAWAAKVLQDRFRPSGVRMDTLWENVRRQLERRARLASFAARMERG